MADYKKLPPFIIPQEGGLTSNKADKASANPVPDGSGNHTQKGITWLEWSTVYGTSPDSIKRFYAMSEEDWDSIFKPKYWDKALADKINSTKIANIIVDFVFNSGQFYPEKDIQEILNTLFGQHLATDGVFGQQTIDAINSAPQDDLYKDIIIRRQKFYTDIIDAAHERNDHSQDQFLQGWMNRILNIVKYNTQFVD